MNKILSILGILILAVSFVTATKNYMPIDDPIDYGESIPVCMEEGIWPNCCGGIGERPCPVIEPIVYTPADPTGESWNWKLDQYNYDLVVSYSDGYATVVNNGGSMKDKSILKVELTNRRFYEYTINKLSSGESQLISIGTKIRSIEANPKDRFGEINNKDNYLFLG